MFKKLILVSVLIGLCLLWLYFPTIFLFIVNHFGIHTDSTKYSELGSIGDIYGGFNGFFTGFSFCLVAYGSYLQYESTKITRKQNFEATFYHLLDNNRKIITLMISEYSNDLTPRKYFTNLSDNFSKFLDEEIPEMEMLSFNEKKLLARAKLRQSIEDPKSKETNGFYTAFKSYKLLINHVKNETLLSKNEKAKYIQMIQDSMYYGEKKALLWLMVTTRNDEYKNTLKDTYLLDLKLSKNQLENEREKTRMNLIKFIQFFEVDKTCFKNYPIKKP